MHRDKEKELIRNDPGYFRKQVIDGLDEDVRSTVQLLHMLDEGNENVIKYLAGGKLNIGEAGFAQSIDSDYAATRMLASIFRVMTLEVGNEDPAFRAVYLFADEVEDMWDLKSPEQLAIWNGFRELLNRLPQNFCLLLSFTGDGALLEATVPQALSERTSRQNIELLSLEVAEAKAFIADHLADFRREEFEAAQPYYPFAEEAIDYVLETIVVMVPRKIFRSLRTVLERAVRREGLQPGEEISAQMAEDILVSMGM